MCSVKDINHRCVLGNIAFNNFSKVWLNNKITLSKKLKLYQAQVVSVIMYNASCWAAPQNVFEKLDACHRRHLRVILNIQWPRSMISNETLYKRCNTTPLSTKVKLARWKMLGHVLRSDMNSPAQAALSFAVNSMEHLPGRVGRHRENLLRTIKIDLGSRGMVLENQSDLLNIRQIAQNRQLWRNLK